MVSLTRLCLDRFSYDLLVVYPDVLSCFLFDDLAYLCVFQSLFIVSVFHHFRCFFIRARGGDDNLYFSGLLIALPTLDALCWIMSVMVSLIMSMSSSSCSVTNWLLISSWNSIILILFYVVSTFGGLLVIIYFLSTSMSSFVLLITSCGHFQC